jgi:hypothetical protein
MTADLFSTPTDEVNRLVSELRETKEALRDLSSRLGRIETRLKRVFPSAFPKKEPVAKKRGPAIQEPPTLTAEQAMTLYQELVDLARKDQLAEVRSRLSSMNLPDLSLLRTELGAPLGKKKPSAKALTDAILGRIKESVMLSKHTNRQQLLDQPTAPKDPTSESGHE